MRIENGNELSKPLIKIRKSMSDKDILEFEGIVIEGNKGQFKVKVKDNYIVSCTLSGKIRINSVKILIGDKVKIEVSPYDVSRGRIVFRIKGV